MKCPKCKNYIDHVTITFMAYQKSHFYPRTNELVSYDSFEIGEFDHKAYCPKCDGDITDSVKEC